MPYHVVCHDCTYEYIRQRRDHAEHATGLHRLDTGHNVGYEGVEGR